MSENTSVIQVVKQQIEGEHQDIAIYGSSVESSSSTYTEDYDISSLPGPILQKEAIAQQKQGAIIIEEVSTSEAENTEAFKAQLRILKCTSAEIDNILEGGYKDLDLLSNASETMLLSLKIRPATITKLHLLQTGAVTLPPKDKQANVIRSTAAASLQGVPNAARIMVSNNWASIAPHRTLMAAGTVLKWGGVVAAGLIFVGQTVRHVYRWRRGRITIEQLAKYTIANLASSGSSVGGGLIGGFALGFVGGSMLLGVGNIIGGIIGAIIGGTLSGWIVEKVALYFGNKLVLEEEHFKKAQQRKQLKKSLKLLNIKEEKQATLELVEAKRSTLFIEYQQANNQEMLLAVYAAYLCVMKDKGYDKEVKGLTAVERKFKKAYISKPKEVAEKKRACAV